MPKWRRYLIIAMACIFIMGPLMNSMCIIVQAADGIRTSITHKASGWFDHEGGTIYDEVDAEEQNEVADSDRSGGEVGLVEELFGEFIYAIAWAINQLEKLGSIQMNNIIYGRVCGFGVPSGGHMVSYFTFELTTNNPYGYVAALLYATFRGVALVLSVCILATKLAAASVKGSGQAREDLKSSFSNFILVMMMLFIMPYLFDLITYIRDHILYSVAYMGLTKFGKINFWDAFEKIYNNNLPFQDGGGTHSFIDALICLGVTILTLYLAIVYVSVALGTTVAFIMFPFVCISSSFDKDAIMRWWKEVIGYMLIPCIDAALLMIPLMMGKIGSPGILQLICCMMIVPARQSIRALLGLNSSSGMDNLGMATAMGAMLMGGRAIGGLSRFAKRQAGKFKDASDSRKESKREQALADGEQAQLADAQDQIEGRNGYNGTRVNSLPIDMEGRKSKQKALDKANKLYSAADAADARGDTKTADSLREDADNIIKKKGLEDAVMPKGNDNRQLDELEGKAKLAAAQGVGLSDVDSSITDKIDGKMSQLEDESMALESANRDLELENEKTKVGMEEGTIDKASGSLSIAKNKEKIARNKQAIGDNKARINALKEERKNVETIARSQGASVASVNYSSGGSSGAVVSGGGMSVARQNEIELRFANVKNFDNGTFRTLTHQQKANLYKKRSANIMRNAVATTVGGTVGGVAGATAGLGMSTFAAPMTKGVFMMGMASAVGGVGYGVGSGVAGLTNIRNNNASASSMNPPITYNYPGGPGDNIVFGTIPPVPTPVSPDSVSISYPEIQQVVNYERPYTVTDAALSGNTSHISREQVVAGRDILRQQVAQMTQDIGKYRITMESLRSQINTKIMTQQNMSRLDAERLTDVLINNYGSEFEGLFD